MNQRASHITLVSRFTLTFWICLGVVRAAAAEDFYVFTSFRGNGEDGLHLALSTDGYHWQALNGDRSFLEPEVGGYRLMRDPCLAQGPDGTFHMVWTSGWTTDKGQVIGYSNSKDLIHWSPQHAIKLMEKEPTTRNLWAPEIFYDRAAQRWLIFWSSTIPGRFPDTDITGDDEYNHRIYAVTTPDFETFSSSRLFFDPGFNVIDATLLRADGKFHLFFKDERKTPLKKNLRYAIATQAEGPFGPPSEPFTGDWVEGPSAIKIKDEFLVYYDHYGQPHYYGAVRSKDLKHWEDCSKELSFPPGHRHGTVVQVTAAVARGLLATP
jgi:beta-xylosidase